MHCCNVYGWTNGHTCTLAASRTDSLIQIIDNELRCHPPLPACIVGDLNAELHDLPAASKPIEDGWTDLGSNAHWWGGHRAATDLHGDEQH